MKKLKLIFLLNLMFLLLFNGTAKKPIVVYENQAVISNIEEDNKALKHQIKELKGELNDKERTLNRYKQEEQESKKNELKEQVSISASDMTLQQILVSLSSFTDKTFKTEKEVDLNKKLTISFKNTKLSYILDQILSQFGYNYKVINKKTISITAVDEVIFKIKNLQTVYSMNSTLGTQVGSSGNNTSSEQSASEGYSYSQSSTGQSDVSVSIDRQDFWEQYEKDIKQLLSKEAKYSINRIAGIVYIKDYHSNIASVKKYTNAILENLSKQVEIQVDILEVQLNKTKGYGIDWYSLSRKYDLGQWKIDMNFKPSTPESGNNYADIFLDKEGRRNMIYRALENYGEIKVLQQPFVALQNRIPLRLTVGQSIPYVDNITSQVVSQSGDVISYPSFSVVEDGISLTLIADISEDIAKMQIIPLIKDVKEFKTFTIQDNIISRPVVNERNLTSTISMKKNQTVILGGIIIDKKSKDKNGVPVLSKIPVLNMLAGSTSKENNRSELVIMLTVSDIQYKDKPNLEILKEVE